MHLSRKLEANSMYVITLVKKFICTQFQTHRDALGPLKVPNPVSLSVISLHSVTQFWKNQCAGPEPEGAN